MTAFDLLTFFGQDPLVATGMWFVIVAMVILAFVDQASPHMKIRR